MAVLSTQVRCNRCGARLSEPRLAECPSCHSDLAQAGVWSELLEWGETRQMGRTRYVWLRGVLGHGGLMALGTSLGVLLFGDMPLLANIWLVGASLVGGYCLGRWYWQSAEREYQAADEAQLLRD